MASIREQDIITFEETDSKFIATITDESKQSQQTETKPKPQDKKKKSKQTIADDAEIPDDEENEDHNIPFIHRHRFYESDLPEVGDIIMTRIDHLTEYSAIVHLLEYNQMPASLPFSELSARRLRETPQKILRVGRPEVLQVLRVDTAKGYIDMTRKNISPEERQECFDRYSSAKLLHSIAAIAVDTVGTAKIDSLYRDMIFPLYAKYDTPLDFFKELIFDTSLLDEFPIEDELKKELVKICKRKLMPKELKIESEVEATCFTAEGIDAIIPAFKAGKEVADQVQISIVSAPLYSLSLVTKEIEEGIQLVSSVIEKVKQELERRGGSLVVKVQPKPLAAH